MENFLVAVFPSYDQARLAAEELERQGFNPADVQLSPDADNASTGQDGAGTAIRSDDNVSGRSNCILSVEAGSDMQRRQAREIVERHAPLAVDERAGHWTGEGWRTEAEPTPGGAARRAAGEGASPASGGRQGR